MDYLTAMPSFSLPLKLSLAGLAGLCSHFGLFIRGEYHVKAPMLLRLFTGLSVVLFLSQIENRDEWLGKSAKASFLIGATYCVFLFSSIATYRVAFHQLHGFSGPFLAKITKFWHMYHCLDSRNYQLMEKLHDKYGDFVRIGPNEVVIFKPEAVSALNGPGSKFTKAAWYDLLLPFVALNTTRDKEFHDQRRRIWDRGFSTKALHDYEDRLVRYAHQLDAQAAASAGRPINVTSWFYLYSFDVVGDLAFGKSFNMLRDGEFHYAIKMLRQGMALLGPFSPVPWLFLTLASIPRLPRAWKTMLAWATAQMSERLDTNRETNDIMSWIISASQITNSISQDRNVLNGDSVAMIVAGSDTVGSALVYLFYHLATDPTQTTKLRAEFASLNSIFDMKALQSLPHLNGMINETLRLHPPVPTGGLRETPPEGIVLGGQYIPGNTVVSVPNYSLGRLESCYERANEFVPERWYSEPQMVKDRSGFAPFSTGRYACVGKNLALMELRSVTALLVSRYDVGFRSGDDGSSVWRDMKDQFTAAPGRLELVFTPR